MMTAAFAFDTNFCDSSDTLPDVDVSSAAATDAIGALNTGRPPGSRKTNTWHANTDAKAVQKSKFTSLFIAHYRFATAPTFLGWWLFIVG